VLPLKIFYGEVFFTFINWSKTEIQVVGVHDCTTTVQVVGRDVEVVERFTYLVTQISMDGSCEAHFYDS